MSHVRVCVVSVFLACVPREEALRDHLLSDGHELFYISARESRRGDFSGARMVVATEFNAPESLGSWFVQELVDDGYWGGRQMGPAGATLWPLHDNPRFADLAAGMEKNYQYQLSELERLRNADMTLAEFHQDFLNRIDRRSTATSP